MDRAQKVDEKNRVIGLVIMFTARAMIIKISKRARFLYFCWWQQNISDKTGKIIKCNWKISLSSFTKWYG